MMKIILARCHKLMSYTCSSIVLALILNTYTHDTHAATVRDFPAIGPQPSVTKRTGQILTLYDASYALLISESTYLGASQGGWTRLDNSGKELDKAAAALQQHGFHVRRVHDATSVELYGHLRSFIASRAQTLKNRILIFYSGHGYTTPNDFGYLVPIDAPDPARDPQGFTEKALPIQTLQLLAQEGRSSHMLFVFDSCFSGSIFMTKGDPVAPDPRSQRSSHRTEYFLGAGQQPVRQFITAGRANERTPEKSDMIPTFIKALEGNLLPGGDGYFTSKELGLWIIQNVPELSKGLTHPQSGVIRDPELAFGDMVFQTPKKRVETINSITPSKDNFPRNSTAAAPASGSGAGACQGETLPVTPHPGMGVAIFATQKICYGNKSIFVSVENIKVKSLSSNVLIEGMSTKLLVYKDGKFAEVRIYPLKDGHPITMPIAIQAGESVTLPSFKTEFAIGEKEKIYLHPPYSVEVSFTVDNRSKRGTFWISNSPHLSKLWDGSISY